MNEPNPPFRKGLAALIRETVATQFVIPVYQRNYTWTAKREVKQYLSDLKNVIEATEPENSRHFMGIIIYYEISHALGHEFSIIDGQQRLTTTFLTLYALRDILIENNQQALATNLEGQYLTNQFCDDSIKLKLKPLINDDDVYQKIINKDTAKLKDSKSNVYLNYVYIKKILNGYISDGIQIDKIIDALNSLYVVCIPLYSGDNVQKIFESINSTGVKLTASDLIRNYILMTIPSAEQDKYYSNYWKKIEDLFSSDAKKMEEFFRFFLASMNGNLCNKENIYVEFKIWYDTNKNNNMPTDIILVKIKDYAEYFTTIKYSNDIDDKELQSALIEFRRNKTDVPTPLLMELFKLNSEKKIKIEQIAKIVRITSTYWIRRELLSMDTKPLSRIFPSLIKTIESACNGDYSTIETVFIKYLITLNRGKAARMPDDAQFKQCLEHDDLYVKRDCLRIILDRLELQDNSAPVDLSKLSVEHLMPQDGTKWYSKLNCTEEEYMTNLHRLGNLTLVSASDNSKAQNNIWEKKQELFASTNHLKLNVEIINKKDWNLKEIEDRTQSLITRILKLYPYYNVELDGVPTIEIHLTSNDKNIIANAIFDLNTGDVQVLKDSTISDYRKAHDFEDYDELYQELIDEEVIEETEHGAIFKEDYTFKSQFDTNTALSTAAGFILQGSRNGKEYWLDETESRIKENAYFLNSKYAK